MQRSALALLILLVSALSLSACGIDRRQDRREDRRDDRTAPVSMTTPAPVTGSTGG